MAESKGDNLNDSFTLNDGEDLVMALAVATDPYEQLRLIGKKREPIQSLKTTLMDCYNSKRCPPFLSLRFNPSFGSAEVAATFRQMEAPLVAEATQKFTRDYAGLCDTYLTQTDKEAKDIYLQLKPKETSADGIEKLKGRVKQAVAEGKKQAEEERLANLARKREANAGQSFHKRRQGPYNRNHRN